MRYVLIFMSLMVPMKAFSEIQDAPPTEFELAQGKQLMDTIMLADVMWCEAGVEGRIGMLAVADVVLNRVKSPRFPNTIPDVITQRHQFECIQKEKPKEVSMSDPLWVQAYDLAILKLNGKAPKMTSATHYHAAWMKSYPYWSNQLAYLGQIGQHRFYASR